MQRNRLALALLTLSTGLPLTACSGFLTREIPVVEKVMPSDRSLLERCRDPQGKLTGNLDADALVLADLAQAFKECQARHARLVEWFGP